MENTHLDNIEYKEKKRKKGKKKYTLNFARKALMDGEGRHRHGEGEGEQMRGI
jgi:hypothetical protein